MNVLKIYNDTSWTLLNVNEQVYKKHNISSDRHCIYYEGEKERISLSRTKRRIKEICLCNNFKYFMTVTVNSEYADRFHLQEVQDKMKSICHKIKRKYKDFKFIFITEKHKNGAFHFHGLVTSLPLYSNDYGYFSCSYFDVLGFNSFSVIQDYNKCCSYITKYITKDCVKNENNQIYFCSRGLKKPSEEVMIDTDLRDIFDDVFINEYCQKKDFDVSRLSEKQKIKLNDYFAKNDLFFQNENNYITNWLKLFTNYSRFGNINIIQ